MTKLSRSQVEKQPPIPSQREFALTRHLQDDVKGPPVLVLHPVIRDVSTSLWHLNLELGRVGRTIHLEIGNFIRLI